MQRNSFLGIVWFLGSAVFATDVAAETLDDADKLAGSEAAWKATAVPVPASAWNWPNELWAAHLLVDDPVYWLPGGGERSPAFAAEARNVLGSDDLPARTERYRLLSSPFG